MPLPHVLAALTLTLSDFSSAQVHPLPVSGTALDLQTTGVAGLTVSGASSAFLLAYSPTFGLLDVTHDEQATLSHGVQVGYSWWTKRLRLTSLVVGRIGTQSYLAIGGLQPDGSGAGLPDASAEGAPDPTPAPVGAATSLDPGGDPGSDPGGVSGYLPSAQVVDAGSVTGSLGMTYAVSRRVTLAAGVAYTVSGGLGSSESVLPQQHGPSASASVAYAATRRDTLSTSLTSAYVIVPTLGNRFITTTVLETWGHQLGRRTQSTLGLGLTHLRSRLLEQTDSTDAFQAAGTAAIVHTKPLTDGAVLGLNALLSLTTPYNPVLGIVQQQVSESAGASWQKDRTTLSATMTANQSLPQSSPTATRIVGFGATADYAITPNIGFQVGARWATQLLPATAGGQIPTQWLAFCALALNAPPIVF